MCAVAAGSWGGQRPSAGWVSVGIDHDTATFAVRTIGRWWQKMGRPRYPRARRLLITADAGGSNGPRLRLWKWELQRLANRTGMAITVGHFPPGTSKWNKIEHRLFSYISANWRGQPLVSLAVIVNLIGATRTAGGLRVRGELHIGFMATGITRSIRPDALKADPFTYYLTIAKGKKGFPREPFSSPVEALSK